jgi:hypothetical protein
MQGTEQQTKEGRVFDALSGKAVDGLNDIQGARGAPQVTPQGKEAISNLTLSDDIQVLPPGQH